MDAYHLSWYPKRFLFEFCKNHYWNEPHGNRSEKYLQVRENNQWFVGILWGWKLCPKEDIDESDS